ncbi:MAG: hypothetical protein JSR69_15415 [Proteobacteria bacterium]|nr:hypothetical protein [Pseudomonadota bacterium]
MANPNKARMSPQHLKADEDTYRALKGIPHYQPYKDDYSFPAVSAAYHKLNAAHEAELHARHTHAATRDALIAAQHDFHELILGVKSQVRAIYGPDSDELAALGLKKKSERKGRGKATGKSGGKSSDGTAA